MNTTIQFPNQQAIEEAAAAWLAAIDRGLTPQEQETLEAWLQQSPLHAETLLSFASLWDKLDALTVVKNFIPQPTSDHPYKPRFAGIAVSAKQLWPAAVSLAACMVIALTLFAYRHNSMQAPTYEADFATRLGEQKDLLLPDGTAITLNTHSQIRVLFSAAQRRVHLVKGEAFFKVAHKPEQPFIVNFNRSSIQVLGTAFNVELNHKQGYEVQVVEGKVSLLAPPKTAQAFADDNSKQRQWLLTGGDNLQFTHTREAHVETRNSASIETTLAWRQGHLLFHGETLQDVVNELNRYTELNLVIQDKRLNSFPVSGYFRATDIDTVLLVLQQNFAINSRQQANTVYLSRK